MFDEQGQFVTRTRWGTNEGTLTITRPDGGQAIIHFSGRASLLCVRGEWQVIAASGSLTGLIGSGSYAGNAGLLFKVTFLTHGTCAHGS